MLAFILEMYEYIYIYICIWLLIGRGLYNLCTC